MQATFGQPILTKNQIKQKRKLKKKQEKESDRLLYTIKFLHKAVAINDGWCIYCPECKDLIGYKDMRFAYHVCAHVFDGYPMTEPSLKQMDEIATWEMPDSIFADHCPYSCHSQFRQCTMC